MKSILEIRKEIVPLLEKEVGKFSDRDLLESIWMHLNVLNVYMGLKEECDRMKEKLSRVEEKHHRSYGNCVP